MQHMRVRGSKVLILVCVILSAAGLCVHVKSLRTRTVFSHKNFYEQDSHSCKMVMSSYIYLTPEQKSMVLQPGSLMSLTCTYILSVLSTYGKYAELRLIGWKSSKQFIGYVSKIKAARLLASSLSPGTILMMTDAFDVIVQKRLECTYLREILEEKYNRKMVFVGEKQCYPLSRRKYMNGEACKDYPEVGRSELSRRLNGGSWVGFAQDVVRACDIFLSNYNSWKKEYFRDHDYEKIVKYLPSIKNAAGQDQYGFAVLYLYGDPSVVAIDTNSEIFITDSGYLRQSGEERTTIRQDGFLFDRVSETFPAVVHFNAGKNVFLEKVKHLPWMQDSNIPLKIKDMPILLGPDLDDLSVISTTFKTLCPTTQDSFPHDEPSISNFGYSHTYEELHSRIGLSEEEFFSVFSINFCSFMIRECVDYSDVYRLSSFVPMPQLAYYNSSTYGEERYLNLSSVYNDLPSVPESSLGTCAFIASGSILSELGKIIDAHDSVIRLSTSNLSKVKKYRGCKVDVVVIKPHRRRFNQELDRCESDVKFYWEPSPVFTYGNPNSKDKNKNPHGTLPVLVKERPILKTIVNYNDNKNASPAYPLNDLASDYVEKLFSSITKKQGKLKVASSGFRLLVQLIMSGRCQSIDAYGFSGKREPVYFSSNRKEKMSFWHDPALELDILKAWAEYKGNKNTSFSIF